MIFLVSALPGEESLPGCVTPPKRITLAANKRLKTHLPMPPNRLMVFSGDSDYLCQAQEFNSKK